MQEKYRDEIDIFIESKKDEMIEDLKKLVRINSQRMDPASGKPFGEGPAMALEQAGILMEAYGLKKTNYDNYVITGDYGDGEKSLDILAHLDVVPVTDEWTITGPFQPAVVNGRIYGRGTADDKGPAIAALYAVRAVRELNIPLHRSVRLIFGSNEECGSSDLKYYYTKEKEAPFTFTPDAVFPVINLEKAKLCKSFSAVMKEKKAEARIVSMASGDKVNVVPAKAEAVIAGVDSKTMKQIAESFFPEYNMDYTVESSGNGGLIRIKGLAAHASTPERGNNAATAMLNYLAQIPLGDCESTKLIKRLAEMFPHGDISGKALKIAMADEQSGALTMNLGILKYESGKLYGELDVRAPLCANDRNLTEKLRNSFKEAGIILESGNMRPAHYVPADSFFVRTLLDSYEYYSGRKGETRATGAGTYVHDLKRGVAFGCMTEETDNHMHGDNEFIEIKTMLMSAKIFADVIVKLCGINIVDTNG